VSPRSQANATLADFFESSNTGYPLTEIDQDFWSPLAPRDPATGFPIASRAGPLVFVAGVSGLDTRGAARPPLDARGQCHIALESMRLALASVDTSLADVCQMTVYIANEADRAEIVVTIRAAFIPRLPAATFLVVPLKPDERVRIAATAVRGDVLSGTRRRRILGTIS
jgi:enamine deaminase RidA (YjgF/YER057c/UK114 family)